MQHETRDAKATVIVVPKGPKDVLGNSFCFQIKLRLICDPQRRGERVLIGNGRTLPGWYLAE